MKPNWELTGHEWAVNLLRRHVANGETRHAYLFAGPTGVGRRTLAMKFAQALLCTKPPAPGESCGECRDCKMAAAMRHPDLAIVAPVVRDGTIKVEQVREAQSLIYLKPYQSRFRISLFLDFQQATIPAQNAMLKTLEEAPAHAILILVANEPEQLLPTIVSRCEVLRLRPAGVPEVERMLEGEGVAPEKSRLLAHIGDGRAGYAKTLLADEEGMATRAQRLEELHALLKSSRVQRFAYAEMLAKTRCKDVHVAEHITLTRPEESELERIRGKCVLDKTLPIWLSFWRDVLLRTAGAETPITNLDQEARINELAARMDVASARKVVANLELGIARLDRNVNKQLLTEVILLDWPHM
ncbi:MAG TPA: DNA polymerase III subunit delta' C-terminal domain-containing protein [Anaerolineales bacterium]